MSNCIGFQAFTHGPAAILGVIGSTVLLRDQGCRALVHAVSTCAVYKDQFQQRVGGIEFLLCHGREQIRQSVYTRAGAGREEILPGLSPVARLIGRVAPRAVFMKAETKRMVAYRPNHSSTSDYGQQTGLLLENAPGSGSLLGPSPAEAHGNPVAMPTSQVLSCLTACHGRVLRLAEADKMRSFTMFLPCTRPALAAGAEILGFITPPAAARAVEVFSSGCMTSTKAPLSSSVFTPSSSETNFL
jgi:hypothetical protein